MKQSSFRKRDGFLYGARRFFGSRWYPPLVMLAFFLGHALAAEAYAAIFLATLTLFGFLIAEDLRFLIPILTGCVCILSREHTPYLPAQSNYYFTGWRLPLIIVGASVLLLGLLLFIVRNLRSAAHFSSMKLKWGFLAFFAALLLAGLFQERPLGNFLLGLGFGVSFLLIYLLFGFFHPKTRENAEHFLYTLVCVGLLVSAELLLLYMRHVEFDGWIPVKGTIVIGWGTWTHIGSLLAMCLPAPFYLAREAKGSYPLWLLAGGTMTVALLLSGSRASFLYGGVILLASFLLLALGGRNRRPSRILLGVLSVLGVIGVILLFPKLVTLLQSFVNFGGGDNGRFAIWRKAVDAFLAAPVFGRGFLNTSVTAEDIGAFPVITPYFYHNTPLQMLASTGAVGILLYLFHRADTVRLFWMRRRSALSLSLLLVPAALLLTSFTDEHIFHFYPAFFYAIAFVLAEGRYDESPLVQK